MITKQVSTPSSALPPRPQRPIKYVPPVTAPDGSVAYDRPLENYFDASMASRLVPREPTTKLYDTVARAHDHRYGLTVDPAWSAPHPLVLNPPERRRSFANLPRNSPDYMGLSPDLPGWRPRRSSYEDRRSAVGVTPSEVNALVPFIPPIDTSLPPPSKERLDEMAKRFLADAHADFDRPASGATIDAASSTETAGPTDEDEDAFFNYDTESTLDCADAIVRRELPQSVSESRVAGVDLNSNMEIDSGMDTESDTDTDSDDGYDWNATYTPPSGPGSQWLIPRKRPSVVILDDKDITMADDSSDTRVASPSPDDKSTRKRRRRCGQMRANKTRKKHANDAPARRGRQNTAAGSPTQKPRDSSCERVPSPLPTRSGSVTANSRSPVSIAAAAQHMQHIRLVSPEVRSSPRLAQREGSAAPPKLFPCQLSGCSQVCASLGDLLRHQQSLRHRRPSQSCLACGKAYTRPDALKRHLNSKVGCKKEHGARSSQSLETGEDEEGGMGAEANDAVPVAGRLG